MSVLRKKPFVEELLESLTTDEIVRLSSIINVKGEPEVVDLGLTGNNPLPSSAPASIEDRIKLINLVLSPSSVYTGILIYHSTSYCSLIGTVAYENDIIKLFKLDVAKRKAEPINEKLTADELRRVIDDTMESKGAGGDKIQVGDILSDDEPEGKAIISDGEGGAKWGMPRYVMERTISEIEEEKGTGFNDFLRSLKPGDELFSETDNKTYEVGIADDGDIQFKYYTDSGVTIATYNYFVATNNYSYSSTETTSFGDVIDSDVLVEISTDDGSTYTEPITLKEFIDNCELGTVYTTDGIIARISNLIDKQTYRLVLIGRRHDALASDNTTLAETTWQFLDMPEHQCRLGLPFNVIDWGSTMGRAYANAYLDGTNENALTWYPSNRGGYITAVGLLNVLHTIYEGLPILLKRAIKTVRKPFNIPRQTRSIAANGGTETDNSTTGYIAQKLFHLSATESGSTSFGTEGTLYPYLNTASARIRYYNGTVSYYWLRTPSPTNSIRWVLVTVDGSFSYGDTSGSGGVAPAFCI